MHRAIATAAVAAAGLAGTLSIAPTATADDTPAAPAAQKVSLTKFGHEAWAYGTKVLLNGVEVKTLRTANAKQIQAVYNYERTVLQAFTDVANQLANIANLQKAFELQQQQVDKLALAVETSNILFRGARADYMEVLLTRRDSLDAQLELVETKKKQFLSTVGIYQALGGGWRMSAARETGAKAYMMAVASVTRPTRACQLGNGRRAMRPTPKASRIDPQGTPRLLTAVSHGGSASSSPRA